MRDIRNSYFVMSVCRLKNTRMYIKRFDGDKAYWTHFAKEAFLFSDRKEAVKWCNKFREEDKPTKLNNYVVVYAFS